MAPFQTDFVQKYIKGRNMNWSAVSWYPYWVQQILWRCYRKTKDILFCNQVHGTVTSYL